MECLSLMDVRRERGAETDISSHLLSLLNEFPVYVMLVDEDHRILLVNEAVRQDLGLSPDQIVGGYCPQVVHGLDGPFPGCPLEEALRKGHAIEREFVDPASGRWLEGVIYPTQYRTEDDRDVFYHMVRDITEKKQAQEALREREEHLRLLLKQMGGILWTTDTGLRVTTGQGAALKNLNVRLNKGTAPSLFECLQIHDPTCPPIAAHHRALKGESVTLELAWQGAAYQSHLEPLRDDAGEIIGVIGVALDVTEHKAMEEQLRRQERLAAVGQMAGGIAHDFRNLLSTSILYAQMSLRNHDLPSDVARALETIVDESHKASDLVQQILDFSGRSTMRVESLHLASLVEEVVAILQYTIREDIQLLLEVGSENHQVDADPTRMQQVLMNLVLNAQDAMPDGGELRVTLSEAGPRLREPLLLTQDSNRLVPGGESAWPEDAGWLCLAVSDTGTGMTEEVQAHLFEPFFTTKEAGEGTGLGLAQVYGIVKQHGGHIDVATEAGEGSTFHVYLPTCQAERGVGDEMREDPKLPRGRGEMILVAEDEREVRKAIREVLTSLGYRVLTAADGREALDLHHSNGQVDLILADRVMPQIGGQRLIEELKEDHPEVRALMITGYPEAPRPPGSGGEDVLDVLHKPLEASTLARAVRQALDGNCPIDR